jgi:hypothetical protein
MFLRTINEPTSCATMPSPKYSNFYKNRRKKSLFSLYMTKRNILSDVMANLAETSFMSVEYLSIFSIIYKCTKFYKPVFI